MRVGSRRTGTGTGTGTGAGGGSFHRRNARGGIGHVGRNGRRLRGGRGRGHEKGGRDGPLLRPFLRRQVVGIVVVRCHLIKGRPLLGSEFLLLLLFCNCICIRILLLLLPPFSFGVWCHRSLVCFLGRGLSSTSSGISGLWWRLGSHCGRDTSSSSDITSDRSRRTGSSRRGIVLLLTTLLQNRLGSHRWRSVGSSCHRCIGRIYAIRRSRYRYRRSILLLLLTSIVR